MLNFERIVSLAVCAAAVALDADAACTISQIAEIPVKMDGRQPIVAGAINGQSVRMLADTGAEASTIIASAAERLGLKERPLEGVMFFGAGGSSKATYVTVDKLQIGNFSSSRPLKMIVIGHDSPVSKGSVEVLLGADFLGQADIEVDLAHNMIRMLRPKDCAEGDVVYWNEPYSMATLKEPNSGHFNVDVLINGKRIDAMLDTGATSSVLSTEGVHRTGLDPAGDGRAAGVSSGIGGRVMAVKSLVVDTFTFDQETIRNARLQVSDMFDARFSRAGSRSQSGILDFPAMLLGADFFLAHRVFIAKSEGKVYITYNGGAIFDDPEKMAVASKPSDAGN